MNSTIKRLSLVSQLIDALQATDIEYKVDSQILDGERWTEVTVTIKLAADLTDTLVCVCYDDTICVYHEGDDLYSSQPVNEVYADGIAGMVYAWWHPTGV